ncbi:hypothetical protein ACG04R_08660 [Roseateles sp. BYS78W]|uniref:Uncharacterized protein n=1 Tax=Pelomonas candidula TaxID=3299025 RepID=A0ABW7HA04_9BURK
MNAAVRPTATVFRAALAWLAAGLAGPALASDADIDRAVLDHLAATAGMHARIAAHLDLTAPFHTASRWTLVIAKQPDEEGLDVSGVGDREGAVRVCFVHDDRPDCGDAPFLAPYRQRGLPLPAGPLLYELFDSRIVHDHAGRPLLSIKACSAHGGNGSCGISTVLFEHDAAQDRFRVVFSNLTGSNNNQETRFIEQGPLRGAVVVAVPTPTAPFVYRVELFRRGAEGTYQLALGYRGHTGYGDGNPLPVIDAEMPALLARLGLWTAGDPLPPPPALPAACTRIFLRHDVEWCDTPTGRDR